MITTINRAIAKSREEGEKGFTLIELLVVILIIGVLAAIAIPAFLNQRKGAWETQVKSDIANAALAAESYNTAHNGKYEDATDTSFPGIEDVGNASLKEFGFNPTPDVTLVVTIDLSGDSYLINGSHLSLGSDDWEYDSATGVTKFTPAA